MTNRVWVNCRKQLPEEDDGTQYLLLLHTGRMAVGFVSFPYTNETLPQWYGEGDAEFDDKEVSHWMHLPEPPTAVTEYAPRDCPVCDGWGSVSTGIDEAPSTLCKACDGNGSLPK